MRRKRIVERFEEFKRNKETDEETNVKDDELVDEVDNIELKDREDKKGSIGKKINTKELSDKEMSDENIGELVEEIKQYLKKIDEKYGK